MASGSNQPFFHNTLSRHTDRQTDRHTHTHRPTDRWDRQQVSKNTAYARYTDRERCAKNSNNNSDKIKTSTACKL